MRILILDDSPDFRRTTGSLLRRMGHECIAYSDCTTALATLSHLDTDILFFDLQLVDRRGDGLELIPYFLATDSGLKVVVVSALASIAAAIIALAKVIRARAGSTVWLCHSPTKTSAVPSSTIG